MIRVKSVNPMGEVVETTFTNFDDLVNRWYSPNRGGMPMLGDPVIEAYHDDELIQTDGIFAGVIEYEEAKYGIMLNE